MKGLSTLSMVAYFLRTYPGRSLLVVLCLMMSGLAEGLGVSMVLPLVAMATGSTDMVPSNLAIFVERFLAFIHVGKDLGVLLTLMVAFFTCKSLLTWTAMVLVGSIVARVGTDFRLALIGALLKAKWLYFVSQPAGHFANAIASEAKKASTAYYNLVMATSSLIQVCVYVTLAFFTSPRIALLGLGAGSLVMLLLGRFVSIARRAGKQQMSRMKSLVGRLVDALNGIKPLKAMAQEQHLLPILEAEASGLNEAQRLQVVAFQTLVTLQDFMTMLLMAIGLYLFIRLWNVPFAVLLVMAFMFSRMVNQINALVQNYQRAVGEEAAFWSLRKRVEQAEREHEDVGGHVSPAAFRGTVRMENVTFGYSPKKLVLSNVSLTIPAGKLVVLVGASGAGKTTIVDLIAGLHRPVSGRILLDDLPLDEVNLQDWRRLIGYVPQEMFLFHDSILKNVTLGDAGISRQAVEVALKAAGTWGFVSGLPEGMDTVIGERGAKLSGGQRQRIALARALVRQPRLLILDEATTSLDPKTEAEICDTLRGLLGQVTILSISHQRALVDVADTVYRVENGMAHPVPPNHS